jgi:hypothetical protein
MRSTLITVTAINLLTMANDNILRNRRRGFSGGIELPSLRARAKLVIAENTLLPIIEVDEQSSFTR